MTQERFILLICAVTIAVLLALWVTTRGNNLD